MNTDIKNKVLATMAALLDQHRAEVLNANTIDCQSASQDDPTILDRLLIDNKKIGLVPMYVHSFY